MTPLGDLYRRMRAALIERNSSLQGTSRLDWIIVLTLARLFVDAEVTELAQAMEEGNQLMGQGDANLATDYVRRVVAAAMAVAQRERRCM